MISKLALSLGLLEIDQIYAFQAQSAICFIMALLILFPLGFNNKMSGFKYLSLISLTSLVYIMFVLLVELPDYVTQNFTYERLNYATIDLSVSQQFAITFLAYACHIEFVPIYYELRRPTESRVMKVVKRGLSINAFFYLIIGMAGYFSTYEETPAIVIEREPLQGITREGPLMIGRILIVVVMCVAFPIKLVTLKQILV